MISDLDQPIVRIFPLGKIHPDANARTDFDQAKLQELADSLKDTKGVLQPLLGTLREDGEVDLIAGERRLRASALAGFTEVEVKLLPKPSRKDHLKWNLVENLQREDLKPLEKAQRVKEMLELSDEGTGLLLYNRASLAAELGISAQSVGSFEALLNAPEKIKKAVNEDGLDMTIGALIGSLPEGLRSRAEREIVFRSYGGPMGREEAKKHIAEKYRRDLRKGQFNREDAQLVPDAGPCSACPFFGANREDVPGKAKGYTCLNPECFDRKQQAHVNKVAAAAEEEGTKVLGQTSTSRIFNNWNNEVNHSCGYVDLQSPPDGYLLKDASGSAKAPKWDKILHGTGAPIVVAFDHDGKVRRLVETKVAIEAAKRTDNAAIFKPKAGENVEAVDDKKNDVQITKAKNKARKAALIEGLGEMFQSFSGQAWSREVQMALLHDLCGNQTRDDLELLCQILQPDLKNVPQPRSKLEELVAQRLDTADKLDAFILIVRNIRSIHFNGFKFTASHREGMKVYCEWAEFDAAGWEKKMDERIKEAERGAKAAIKEKNNPKKTAVKGKVKATVAKDEPRSCRDCGCTEKTGGDWYWVEADLCSACSGETDYHCDKCGLVCPVSGEDVAKVEAMKPGEFVCIKCRTDDKQFCGIPFDDRTQREYETWTPEPSKASVADEHREFYNATPQCTVSKLKHQFDLDQDEAERIFDALVDEKYGNPTAGAEKPGPGSFGKGPIKTEPQKDWKEVADAAEFDVQVTRVQAGESYPTVLGARPAEGTPARKKWEAAKVRIWKEVQKRKKALADKNAARES